MTKNIDTLNKLIVRKDKKALATLNAMTDFCVEDAQQCTPLAAAVRSSNLPAMQIILNSEPAIEYFPKLEPNIRRVVSQQASMQSVPTIELLESRIGASVGGNDNWHRTPLLEACRTGNRDAIQLLIGIGAKLNVTDILQETALSLCLYVDSNLAEFYIDSCIEAGKKFPIDDTFLSGVLSHPELYAKSLAHGRLTKSAKHFSFCLACALLDLDEVRRQLDNGYQLSDKRPYEYNPLLEAVSSNKLVTYTHAEANNFAQPLLRAFKNSPTDSASQITNLEDITLEDIEAQLEIAMALDGSEDDQATIDRVEAALPQDIDPTLESDGRVTRRLELIDLLASSGLKVSTQNSADPFPFLDYIILSNEPRLLAHLRACGLKFKKSALKDHNSIQLAIQNRCFRMVDLLVDMGCPFPEPDFVWRKPHSQYQVWAKQKDSAKNSTST